MVPFIEGRGSAGFRKTTLSISSSYPGGGNRLSIRMSGGSFSEDYGSDHVTAGAAVAVRMAEKGGYLEEYRKLQIGKMSNDRSEFPSLTDEEFANYRSVATTGMKKGVLYRTSSPINPMVGRNKIVDEANRRNGVTTIINLSETSESAAKREGYDESYYKTVNHYEADMSTDFGSETFNEKFAGCMRFMTAHPGVYEVNCVFGKDRTGFMIAVLEGLMGASYDELVNDYAATYPHYYPDYSSYEPLAERDSAIAETNLIAQLEYAYGVDDLRSADIRAASENYLRKIGLEKDEIGALRSFLAEPEPDPEPEPEPAPTPTPTPTPEPTPAGDPTAAGTIHTVNGSMYAVTAPGTVSLVRSPSRESFTLPGTIRLCGKTFAVTGIQAKAFRGTKVKTLTVKTGMLTKRSVRGSLRGSKVKTVKIKVGKKKASRKYVKKYRKIFTRKNAGKKVTVKR